MDILIILLFVTSYFELGSALDASVALVNSTDGMVRGRVARSGEGLPIQEFLGIPFAQPPVNELRFANPVPVEPWSDVYNATEFGKSCYQPSFLLNVGPMSEDCLSLNIWTPQPRPRNATVMVWIYGGAFEVGTTSHSLYDGKILVSRNDVIMVSMNYRLGALGFLATGDGRIQGNFGLMDQALALQWIQRNIATFGGNPDSVTIFGESAGAASVGFHILSPVSRSLFKRAIMQSGTPTATWALMSPESARLKSRQFFMLVGCPDDEFVLQCIQNQTITPDVIVTRVATTEMLADLWAPTTDEMVDRPSNHLAQSNLKKTELLLGSNKDEGSLFVLFAGLTSVTTISDLTSALNTANFNFPLEVQEMILHRYSGNLNTSNPSTALAALNEIVGDRNFVCPTVNLADVNLALGLQTYLYSLEYIDSKTIFPERMGVVHGADMQWVFGVPLKRYAGYKDDEIVLSERIMAYWTNFAKYGDPNGNGTEPAALPNWPQYNHAHEYLSINGGHSLSGKPLLKGCTCKFWKIIDSLYQS